MMSARAGENVASVDRAAASAGVAAAPPLKHPLTVDGWHGSLEELAHAVGRMRYDRVAAFLEALEAEIGRQAEGDAAAGRRRLSDMLEDERAGLSEVAGDMRRIWEFCKPFMAEEIAAGEGSTPAA